MHPLAFSLLDAPSGAARLTPAPADLTVCTPDCNVATTLPGAYLQHAVPWFETLIDLLYPPRCCVCDSPSTRPGLCDDCAASMRRPQSPLCPRCGIPFQNRNDTDHPCGACTRRPPAFDRARACAVFDSSADDRQPLRTVIHQLKYDRRLAVARPLRRLLAERAPAHLAACEVLVPVPLHRDRLRWRGFNQSLVLVRDLARDKCIPVAAEVLVRTRPTRPQVGLDPSLRAANVAGAFAVTDPERIRHRNVLLVDDVMTTGSTVQACATALRRAGARRVEVLVLARAVRD